ncbi:hypothetical protein F9L33_05280 [Amylibacter sp. SFDW26]|uniref:hypothetical protein n=1 Tax=Amylibacter sp. SFDW26 TaxID=2652722 RepID=UPI0012624413|nr:hypothetical protein [Amylibacter sp. SFDW26]KAB7616165.1 hypothetical protein F9L33_05280 [Amylibacter sp. SFDW26]
MKILLTTCAISLLATPLFAGPIERACNASDRQNASRSLCSCIQDVADVRLSSKDQKQAAKFFKEPQLAQDTRQSDNAAKERFWLRYKEWGQIAALQCAPS